MNKRSPVANSKTIQARDQISASGPYGKHIIASGDLYCLVWISSVKCLSTQQAFPRSAILTIVTGSSSSLDSIVTSNNG